MPYVKRDQAGNVTGIFRHPSPSAPEYIPDNHVDMLGMIKKARRRYINERKRELMASGVKYNGNTYDSDEKSIQTVVRAAAAFASGVPVPTELKWTTADDKDVAFTHADVVGLAASMFAAGHLAHKKSRAAKQKIKAATTIAAVNTVEL